jgi:hypothetical protein
MRKCLPLPDPHIQVRQFLHESNYRAHLDRSLLFDVDPSPHAPISTPQISALEAAVTAWCDSHKEESFQQILSAKSALLSLHALIRSNFIGCLIQLACGPTPFPTAVEFLSLLIGTPFEEAIANAKILPQICHALHGRGFAENAEYATAVHRLFAIISIRSTQSGRLRKQLCSVDGCSDHSQFCGGVRF